jgi:lambda repressor-like predicted transcriptional regulator
MKRSCWFLKTNSATSFSKLDKSRQLSSKETDHEDLSISWAEMDWAIAEFILISSSKKWNS